MMCGRFTLTLDPDELREAMPYFEFPSGMSRRFNIAPGQPIAAIPNDGQNRLDFFVWGLIPSWAKDPQIGNKMINARAETLAEKPSFRNAFKRRRCLILADGFYEWKSEEQNGRTIKTPMYIKFKDNHPFAFAGLWETWQATDGSEVRSCAIITTEPNAFMKQIHNRMPVILPQTQYAKWLDPKEADPASLQGLLIPYPPEELNAFPVSRRVNDPANDTAECILPAES
jgi:putative SOS response-associated peptidase YedK